MTEHELNDILSNIEPAPPLPKAEGKVVKASSPIDIIRAIEDADENTTIEIAKGHYMMPRDCLLTTSHVTIRGETGNRDDVILDSGMEFNDTTPVFQTRMGAPAIIKMTQAKHVTIADLTLANNPKYGVLFFGGGRVHNLKIYNVVFHNIWARGLKGTGSARIDDKIIDTIDVEDPERIEWVRPRHGEIRHCLFLADKVKANDEDGFDGDYIAGMDLMNVCDWVVADNTFVGIRGKNGGGRGAVFIWQHADRVTVENNHFYHCDRGVSLGNPSGQDMRDYHIRDSVIRGNTFVGGCNKAVEVDYGNNVEVSGNTIESEIRKDYAAVQVINISEASAVTGNTITLHGEEPFNCDDCVTIDENTIQEATTA